MRVVYLAHPLGAGLDRERNRENAARWVAWATLAHGVAVVADWIVLAGVLAETPANRVAGLAADLELVGRADELWLVGGRISPGMALEAEEARRRGIPVVDFTRLGTLPPPSPCVCGHAALGHVGGEACGAMVTIGGVDHGCPCEAYESPIAGAL